MAPNADRASSTPVAPLAARAAPSPRADALGSGEPGGDVLPPGRRRLIHLIEGVTQVLQRRGNAVEVHEVLAAVEFGEVVMQLGERHFTGEAGQGVIAPIAALRP